MPLEPGDLLLLVGQSQQIRDLHRGADFIVFEPNLSDLPVDTRQAFSAILLCRGAPLGHPLAACPSTLRCWPRRS